MQAFDRGLPLPEERVALLFDLGGPPAEVGAPSWPTTRRSATATASARAARRVRRRRSKTRQRVMDATRAGKGCGSCKRLVAQIVEWAAGGDVEEDPRRAGTCPACRCPSRS
jgi:nitrite reductase (NADH) large subunit